MTHETLRPSDYDSRTFQFIGDDGQEISPPDDGWIYEKLLPPQEDGSTWWVGTVKKEVLKLARERNNLVDTITGELTIDEQIENLKFFHARQLANLERDYQLNQAGLKYGYHLEMQALLEKKAEQEHDA